MKKLIALLLMLCLVTSLCACGGNNTEETTTEPEVIVDDNTTEEQTQDTTEEETTEPEATGTTYTVKVVDEGGNPVVGAFVQICAEVCVPALTDDSGVATFANQETRDDYKVSFSAMPEGYELTTEETEFYFTDGATEMTITLKAIA